MPNTPGSRAVATHRSVSGIALALVLACLVAPVSLGAQGRLLERVTVRGGAVYENWSFPTAIAATAADGSAENVAGGSQLTIPVALVVSIAPGWTADVYSSYVRGEVRLASAVGTTPASAQRLDGLTDTKVRLTGQLAGDALMFTAGLTLPTGATSLDADQLSALTVLSSPALRFQSPVLGAGAGATAGLILSREVGGWGLALGAAYEARGSYSPAAALQAGLPAGSLRPGNAIHLSLAGEQVRGALRQLVSVTGDLYQGGELRDGSGATG